MGRAETLRKYGMTEDDYEWKLKEQDYRCAICRKMPKHGKRLVVDHDHATGCVRSLLCNQCNTRLGVCHDSPRILAAMLVYLEDHGIRYSMFNAEWEKECVRKPSLRTRIPPEYALVDADRSLSQSESGNDSIPLSADSEHGTESIRE